ncbi:MAG: transcriptional regulator [Alphaproteobacteria bacterium]|nr:transcriptional regulator [Alphaproteobacteria bacterium]
MTAAVTIGIASLGDAMKRAKGALSGRPQGHFISFASHELMQKTLTPKRWELIKSMAGAEPMSIREAARRVGRDVKSVHGDVQALLKAGVIDKTEDGLIVFPYTEIHVDFILRARSF